MFANLSKGNILYGLDKSNDTTFIASIEKIVPSIPRITRTLYGQSSELTVDISATVNGEHKEFKQVPSNNAVADFGDEGIVLADNKDSFYDYVNSQLQVSENIVASAEKHKPRIPKYKSILANLSHKGDDAVVQELKSEVSSLKEQLAEAIALLKSGNNNKLEQHEDSKIS